MSLRHDNSHSVSFKSALFTVSAIRRYMRNDFSLQACPASLYGIYTIDWLPFIMKIMIDKIAGNELCRYVSLS